jgi:hypothetical protein
MSWWVSLNEKGKSVEVDRFTEGGTYAIGGQTEAALNITYNYGKFYKSLDQDKGLEYLDRKKAKTCIPKLENAVKALGIDRSNDYWESTSGNAGYALSILLKWAKQHTNARFKVI